MQSSLSLPASRVHEMDWWDERLVKLTVPGVPASSTSGPSDSKTSEKTADGQVDAQVRITCTPSQHTSGRTGFDRWSTLWGAYVIEELLPPSSSEPPTSSSELATVKGEGEGLWSRVGKKVYFAGDTGYKTVHVHKGEKEDDPVAREVCPAFKEVGERFGGVDGAMLPIGYVLYILRGFVPADSWVLLLRED